MSDTLCEASDDEVRLEYRYRFGGTDLDAVYEEFRKRGDAPQCLRDYLYETLGRILP